MFWERGAIAVWFYLQITHHGAFAFQTKTHRLLRASCNARLDEIGLEVRKSMSEFTKKTFKKNVEKIKSLRNN